MPLLKSDCKLKYINKNIYLFKFVFRTFFSLIRINTNTCQWKKESAVAQESSCGEPPRKKANIKVVQATTGFSKLKLTMCMLLLIILLMSPDWIALAIYAN